MYEKIIGKILILETESLLRSRDFSGVAVVVCLEDDAPGSDEEDLELLLLVSSLESSANSSVSSSCNISLINLANLSFPSLLLLLLSNFPSIPNVRHQMLLPQLHCPSQ